VPLTDSQIEAEFPVTDELCAALGIEKKGESSGPIAGEPLPISIPEVFERLYKEANESLYDVVFACGDKGEKNWSASTCSCGSFSFI